MKCRRLIGDGVAQDYDVIREVPDCTPILRLTVEEAGVKLRMVVLDVATGTGAIGLELAEKGGEYSMVVGVDSSKPMLEQAVMKKKTLGLNNIDFVLADACDLPFIDQYFDAVTSCFTFAFLSSPEEADSEMARVVRLKGKVISVEREKPPHEFWAQARRKGGVRDFQESELIKILFDSGFRKIHNKRVRVMHRRTSVSEELVKKSQLLTAKLISLEGTDSEQFFSKISEEYQKTSP